MAFSDDVDFVAFDLETTGLSPAFCRIVEFGAVRFLPDGTEISRMQQLADPGCPVPAGVTAIHGITDVMLRGRPTVEEVLPEFLRVLGGTDTILTAHNASFDIGFVSAALARTQMNLPCHRVVDTMCLSRRRLSRIPDHRLETIGRHFGVTDSTEHRALGDALVVKSVFLRLLDERPAIGSLDELLRAAPPLRFEPAILASADIPAGYESLAAAIEVAESVVIVYEGGTKGRTSRRITPRGVIESNGNLYLIARCHIDDVDKHFRLDRIREIQTG